MKRIKYLIAISFLVSMVSCSKDDSDSATVVINEFMPLNDETVADQDGEYDDWIELYNNSDNAIDLTGYYMSDNDNEPTKWEFPSGTQIEAHGYLIIWADDDTSQDGLHASFKLSADGEQVLLVNSKSEVVDQVTFGNQTSELSYSRIPNGTGSFSWQYPTFNSKNIQTIF